MSYADNQKFCDQSRAVMLPKISDELVATMQAQMTPVIGINFASNPHRKTYLSVDTKGVDPRNVAFTWSPKYDRPVRLYDKIGSVDLMTFHTWGYYGFFKPSLAEVFACINAFIPDWSGVKYFSVELLSTDLGISLLGDYHVARCRIWGSEALDVISEGWPKIAKEAEEWLAARNVENYASRHATNSQE